MSERDDDFRADQGQGGYYVTDEEDAPPARRSLVGPLVVALGLSAFGGIIWYAYNQGTRAGTESVAPIVRADPSPTKIRPEQPGGMDVPHQDKLVYDRLNPTANEAGVERLLPPPEAPLERPKPLPPEPKVAELPPEEAPAAPAPAQPAPAAQAAVTPPAAAQPPAPTPLAPPKQLPAATPAQAAPAPASPAPGATAPAATAQVPVAQPQAAVKPPATAPATATPAATPAAPVAGGVRIQIASVPSEDIANKEWQRLSRKHAGVMGGLGMRVVKADLGAKGVYYRVQAGPTDEARAKSICDAMKAQADGCILVRN
ncbi:MAG TPA: SPOR domain-containing protein [Azospirillaceae bacterium]|nr:SPOR domain-containing protein [Azospirillaceae bacterium]